MSQHNTNTYHERSLHARICALYCRWDLEFVIDGNWVGPVPGSVTITALPPPTSLPLSPPLPPPPPSTLSSPPSTLSSPPSTLSSPPSSLSSPPSTLSSPPSTLFIKF